MTDFNKLNGIRKVISLCLKIKKQINENQKFEYLKNKIEKSNFLSLYKIMTIKWGKHNKILVIILLVNNNTISIVCG